MYQEDVGEVEVGDVLSNRTRLVARLITVLLEKVAQRVDALSFTHAQTKDGQRMWCTTPSEAGNSGT